LCSSSLAVRLYEYPKRKHFSQWIEMTDQKDRKILNWVLTLILLILTGLLIWGISWAIYARPPLPEALEALESNEQILVYQEPWLSFTPQNEMPDIGLIFYPGGRIDPRGYSPLLKQLSIEGYLVVVPSMPLNMAVFNSNIADEIIDYYDEIKIWVIGGHSVGGTAAAMYSSQKLDQIAGLVIWASYPAGSSDLSATELPVTLIFGELDPRVNQESVNVRKKLLPSDTIYFEIQGGDHHQFGSYLTKPGESNADIPRAVQQELIIQETLNLLSSLAQTE
jgi:predicted esterase